MFVCCCCDSRVLLKSILMCCSTLRWTTPKRAGNCSRSLIPILTVTKKVIKQRARASSRLLKRAVKLGICKLVPLAREDMWGVGCIYGQLHSSHTSHVTRHSSRVARCKLHARADMCERQQSTRRRHCQSQHPEHVACAGEGCVARAWAVRPLCGRSRGGEGGSRMLQLGSKKIARGGGRGGGAVAE